MPEKITKLYNAFSDVEIRYLIIMYTVDQGWKLIVFDEKVSFDAINAIFIITTKKKKNKTIVSLFNNLNFLGTI